MHSRPHGEVVPPRPEVRPRGPSRPRATSALVTGSSAGPTLRMSEHVRRPVALEVQRLLSPVGFPSAQTKR